MRLPSIKENQFNSPARLRALSVLSRMRRGTPLSHAVRLEHTTVRSVRRHVGSVLIRDDRTGRYTAKNGDTFRRDVNVLGTDGYVPVTVRSSNQARLDADHLVAVGRFLRTGDTEWLKPFIGKRVGGVELLIDPERLQILADAGLVKLDGLYRHNRAGRQGR
jgi:hypothetical protein